MERSAKCLIRICMEIMNSGLPNLQIKRKITEAIKLSVKDDYVIVGKSGEGLVYSLNERGREIVTNIQSPYSKAYVIGARIVCRKFANYTDEAVLKYISKLATESKEV